MAHGMRVRLDRAEALTPAASIAVTAQQS
jgi:hypothetical protein